MVRAFDELLFCAMTPGGTKAATTTAVRLPHAL